MRVALIFIIFLAGIGVCEAAKNISFADDFEKGAAKWDFTNPDRVEIKASQDPKHGNVLCLHSGGSAVYALIKGSDNWTNIRVEGDVYFPSFYYHYMGLIYNYNGFGGRVDFGSVFLLGPFGEDFDNYWRNYRDYLELESETFLGNVVWVNPHRDSNANRQLYPEYWVTLKGEAAVKPREWHHFKAEIAGPVCHFYVDDMKTPKVTYDYFEYSSGRVGFKPRFVGSECWLDNITVASIKELSYKGPALPAGRTYKPERFLTEWHAIGPFYRRIKEIEAEGFLPGKSYVSDNREFKWNPFHADGRGCVVSARVCERFSGRRYAYFHTEIPSESKKEVTLHFTSTNNMVFWVNQALKGNISARFAIWDDFWYNIDHQGDKFQVTLEPGINHVTVLVRGGSYGGDGFYALCSSDDEDE